jgi:Mrp family chromosome partitioning ATPase
LSGLSDRIVFVVGWRDTAKEVVARSLQRLGHANKIAGLVLNKVDESKIPHQGRNGHRKSLAYQRYYAEA